MYCVISFLHNVIFHLWRQKSNCSSYIVTPFMEVLFGVIHTRTPQENLLAVIVTHSNVLLTSPDTPAPVRHLRWTQLIISMWCSANSQLHEQSNSFPQQCCYCMPLSIAMHIISLHWWVSWRVCFLYRKNHK